MTRSRFAGLGAGVGLGLAAAAVVAVAGVAFHSGARAEVDARLEGRLESCRRELRRHIETRGDETRAIATRLASRLGRDPSLAMRLGASEPAGVDLASRWSELLGVDLLTVVDERGRVIRSAHWPEQVGLDAGGLLELPVGAVSPMRVRGPLGDRVLIVAHAAWAAGDESFGLLVGRRIDQDEIAAALSGLASIRFTDAAESDPLSGSQAGPVRARTTRVGLDDVAGRTLVQVDLTVEDPELERIPRRLGQGLASVAIAVFATGLLAGTWLVRRARRPVAQLVQAVDSIGAGRADYTFPHTAADEFQELQAAFSRLQRNLDLQVQRSAAVERVATWREVARQVAHEVKNPLAPIRLTVENLQRARRKDAQLFDSLFEDGARTILEEVEQLRRLVGEFAEFARLPAPRRTPVELEPWISSVLELYAAEPDVEMRRDFDTAGERVEIDVDQFGRALKNVIGNAIEALRDPGAIGRELVIETRRADSGIEIRVRDRGPGIAEEARRRIFRPYFTTKKEGTGLGMAITHRIVTEHGGLISVGPNDGGGTVVEIRLPVAAAGEHRT